MVIILKWSKTLQDRKEVTTVTIPALGSSALCPCKALTTLVQSHPLSDDHPLFLFYKQGHWVTLTDSMARKHLKRVCLAYWVLQSIIRFMIFAGVGLPGLSDMVFLSKIYKHRVPGLASVCGDTFNYHLLPPHLWLTLFSSSVYVNTTTQLHWGFGCFSPCCTFQNWGFIPIVWLIALVII